MIKAKIQYCLVEISTYREKNLKTIIVQTLTNKASLTVWQIKTYIQKK